MDALTHRQEETLAYVIDYMDKHGYAPVMREIVTGTSCKSTSTVQRVLDKLVSKGYLTRSRGTSRGLLVKRRSVTCAHEPINAVYAAAVGRSLDGFVCLVCGLYWTLEQILDCLRSGLCQPSKKEPDSPLSNGPATSYKTVSPSYLEQSLTK